MASKAEAESLRGRIGRHSDPSSPDSIIQSDLPQLSLEDWDAEVMYVLGRSEGPLFDSLHTQVDTPSGKIVVFSRPTETRFVRVQMDDGSERMEPYNAKRHGEWAAIPDTGLTPPALFEQLMGFGTEEIDQSQQFNRIRKQKGGASHKYWPIRHTPKIK